MATKKKQHFVPRFYLKRFADENGLIDIYHINRSECYRKVNHKDQCKKTYFYGTDLEWENRLSKMESDWNTVFTKIDKKSDLTSEDLKQIKLFALFQRQRTSGEFEYRYNERLKLYELYAQKLFAHKGWIFDDEAKKEIKKHVDESISPSEMLEFAQHMQKYIEDLDVRIIEYSTKKHLIISDVPVISLNPFHSPSIGYGCVGLVILFPISPNVLISIYDPKMYRQICTDRYVTLSNEAEIVTLNNLQFVSAEEILLGNESDFPIPDTDLIESRANSRNQDAVTCLGSEDNQLWVTSMRKTIYHCDLSFAHVNHQFRRITFECREGVPRFWDEGWENKLKNKADILCKIRAHSPGALSGLTIKDIRDGCNRFYREMMNYWDDTRKT